MVGSSNDFSPDSSGNQPKPDIWLCHQAGSAPGVAPDWLTFDERERLSGLSPARAAEFLTSRWLIRQALSRASAVQPGQCWPVQGRAIESASPPGWHLSLSHSNGLSACGTQYGSALGVDIEPSKRHPQWQKVVKRWFSPVEQEWLFQEDDPHAFLWAWTLKEAWLKATGRGIAGNLQTLEVRRNFELYGDQPDDYWQACAFYTEGFLCTLVFRQTESHQVGSWPAITLLEPPSEGYSLSAAESLDTHWEPMFQRRIRLKR
ncbi:4'-phosphopantetheinyl transferase family protein [Marinobacter sp.]|uniref:4'-phosphopantetheinyl transferase family protein n=1 Tax=Marinobacter sp. TaxID=50741 RepID=UPI003A909335